MNMRRLGLWMVLVGLAAAVWWVLEPGRLTSVQTLRDLQTQWSAWANAHPLSAAVGFFALYVLATALSVPGMATALTLLGGALFGVIQGTLIVSFASAIGATLAFLSARYLLREPLRRRFGGAMAAIDAGISRDGPAYLFGLRLVPIFPFFLVNLAMGLTPLRTATFYGVSQIAMLPATL
ncbi:MAG: VTT domain-containing protein, partial [Burkholderiales bacterium]|nr:VTT domain-containing protein [Burkholderiales bacterium]